jgi:signal transduction histidine kinase
VNVSDRIRVTVSRVLVVLGIAGGVTGIAAYWVAGDLSQLVDADFAIDQLIGVTVTGIIVWLALPRSPTNGAIWVLAWVCAVLGLEVGGAAVGFAVTDVSFTDLAGVIPSELEPAGAIAFFVAQAGWASFLLFLTFGVLLFPDGKLPSSRWRWLARVAGSALTLVVATAAWTARPWSNSPYYLEGDEAFEQITLIEIVGGIAILVTLLCVVASLVSLFMRFRRSSGVERQQFRWMAWGFTIFVVGSFIPLDGAAQDGAGIVTSLVIATCYGVAITRYRLYDIDVIISRTVVYGLLAAFIGGVYVAVVVGVGSLFGAGTEPNPVLAVLATALVAVLFQPVRSRLTRVANRIAYGKRATPYEVLSEFSRQVAATDESLLEPVARMLTEGTVATAAAVWLLEGRRFRKLSSWPDDASPESPEVVEAGGRAVLRDSDAVFPITHEGDLLGALSVTVPAGPGLTGPDRALAEEVAAGMGLALRNMQLTHALRDRINELRESRRRIVAVQDETRRRLERDLHDGAQQRLVALKVKLALAGQMAARDGATRTNEFLRDLSAQADDAVAALREFARGVYPPLLEAEGLEAALRSATARLPIAVDVAADGLMRYPKEIEATVYFCVLEALQNVVKFSGATSAQVRVRHDKGGLTFEVRDAGKGFDLERVVEGSGLLNMRDRLDAGGGVFTIEASPGAGTVVRGNLPVPAAVVT